MKTKASGVVSGGGSVVEVKTSATPPIVTVVSTLVENDADAVCRARTLSPLFAVPAVDTKPPPLMLYRPPLPATLIGVGALTPEIETLFEVTVAPSATFVWSTKTKAFGVVSGGGRPMPANTSSTRTVNGPSATGLEQLTLMNSEVLVAEAL